MSFFGKMFKKKDKTAEEDPGRPGQMRTSQQKVIVSSSSKRNLVSSSGSQSSHSLHSSDAPPSPPKSKSATSSASSLSTQKPTMPPLAPGAPAAKSRVATQPGAPPNQTIMPEKSLKALVKIQRFAKKVIIQKANEDEENWKVNHNQ